MVGSTLLTRVTFLLVRLAIFVKISFSNSVVIGTAVFAQCSPTGKNLLRLVAENNRTKHLDGISFKVKELYQEHLGLVEAVATSFSPLDCIEQKQLEAYYVSIQHL